MTRLDRYSEPFTATGGAAAEGILNQLGRPHIHPLEVLVREAVQNSWDARRDDEPTVAVEISRYRLSQAQATVLRQELLADPPPGLDLPAHIAGEPEILYFADYGTTGLGGLTRGNRARELGESDFADFVFISGAPPDKALGGGSYGFGKASFFIASAANTVVIDTLCWFEGRLERRLIASALGESFTGAGGILHTGRHWWGRVEDGAPRPVLGEEAERLATALGLPQRRSETELGTTIAIVAPDSDPDDGVPTPVPMDFVGDCLLWNFWPKMVGTDSDPTMRFELREDGRTVSLAEPRRHPRLAPFVEAMDALRTEQEDPSDPALTDPMTIDRTVRSLRPQQLLGRLVLRRVVSAAAPPTAGDLEPHGASLTRNGLHHVALMRTGELVVRYLPGREPATGRHGYAGVFRCALPVDQAFRASEPPTHDNWVFESVTDPRQRSFVKKALEQIREACKDAAGVATGVVPQATGDEVPLGAFADSMAELMPGSSGPGARSPLLAGRASNGSRGRGAEIPAGSGGTAQPAESPTKGVPPGADGSGPQLRDGGPAARGPRVMPAGQPELRLDSRLGAVLACPFRLVPGVGDVILSARVEVMVGDGNETESDPPAGWSNDETRLWIGPSGERLDEARPTVGAGAEGTWSVLVPATADAMVRVDIAAESPAP